MAKHKRGRKTTGGKQGGTGKKPPLTHFLCIPLVTPISRPQLAASLQTFNADVSRSQEHTLTGGSTAGTTAVTEDPVASPSGAVLEGRGPTAGIPPDSQELPQIPEKAIRPVGTLHLTLGVMSLMGEDEIREATLLLKGLNLHAVLKDAAKEAKQTGQTAATNQPESKTSQTGESSTQTVEASSSHDQPSTTTTSSWDILGSSLPAEPSPSTPESTPSPSPAPAHPGSPLHSPTRPQPLTLSLTGLHSMHPPRKTSILYASPQDPTNRLQPFCHILRDRFQAAGFLVPDDRPLKLHATVVNTIYAKAGGRRGAGRAKEAAAAAVADGREGGEASGKTSPLPSPEDMPPEEPPGDATATAATAAAAAAASGHGPNARALLRFDATALLQRYREFVWARDVKVEKVAICKMGAKKVLNEKEEVVGEEYEEIASVRMPGA